MGFWKEAFLTLFKSVCMRCSVMARRSEKEGEAMTAKAERPSLFLFDYC